MLTRRIMLAALSASVAFLTGMSSSLAATDCLLVPKAIQPGPFTNGNFSLFGGAVLMDLSVGPFFPPTSPPAFGTVIVGSPRAAKCFSGDPSLDINNANLMALISSTGAPVTSVSIEYCDLGGSENFSARGAPALDYKGDIDLLNGKTVPAAFGLTANVTVAQAPVGGVITGKLDFTTKMVTSFAVGGQEFAVHQICVTQ